MSTLDARTEQLTAIDSLARDLERVESLRAVKSVQRRYAQLSQFGQWDQLSALFARDGTVRWGDTSVTGPAAIGAWLRTHAGEMDGRTPGSLHTEIIDEPLVNLSVDGTTAQGRWMTMRFLGDGAGCARIEGGLYENDYVREDGTWLIATLHYHPQFDGEYADGWTNVDGEDLGTVPMHFNTDEAGTPIPPAVGTAPPSDANAEELVDRIGRLNDEDAVRNIQNAYGYYVDRRMWSDVLDLFADDGMVRIAGVGEYSGQAGIREALERMGPEGLSHGQLNERPIFDLTVDVLPGRHEAVSRGIELGILAEADKREGAWEFSVLQSRFVKDDGLWKLSDVSITPLLHADYDEGWGNGGSTAWDGAVPEALAATATSHPSADPSQPAPIDLADLERRLARSQAYDGAENVSSAYGLYLDDFRWHEMAAIIAVDGNKQSPFAGYYLGRDRVLGAVNASWGPAKEFRSVISFHWRTQPVIHVSHDGRSANLRTRLFQPRSATDPSNTPPRFYMGGLHSGMYPNDQAVLEDGTWRLWSVTIDEHYMETPTWKGGWASAVDRPDDAPSPSKLLSIYPPDVLLTELGRREDGFRGGTGTMIEWPSILPMWFHYRNPVSGRVPELYWPDCVPYEKVPSSRMTEHGYQKPPTGPEIDGVDLVS